MSRLSVSCKAASAFAASVAFIALAGCSDVSQTLQPKQTFQNGYIVDEETLALVPEGSSREQVILALGTPSTKATFDEKEAYYYISQQRVRSAAFMKSRLVDQRVLAVYFSDDDKVERIANYGLQDGKVFDFLTRTTPTGGADASFIVGVIRGATGGGTPGQAARSVFGGL